VVTASNPILKRVESFTPRRAASAFKRAFSAGETLMESVSCMEQN
jgi:hypothetical protein